MYKPRIGKLYLNIRIKSFYVLSYAYVFISINNIFIQTDIQFKIDARH